MSELNQSFRRGLNVFECLFEDGFEGRTLQEICDITEIPSTTAWRLLKTLEAKGWVVEAPIAGSKQGCWRVSSRLAGIAHAYERFALERVHGIKSEFREVTGKELNT